MAEHTGISLAIEHLERIRDRARGEYEETDDVGELREALKSIHGCAEQAINELAALPGKGK